MSRSLFVLPFLTVITTACNPFESKFYGMCEEVLKDRLKAPSSYQRISITESFAVIPIEEYRTMLTSKLDTVVDGKYGNPEGMANIEYRVDRVKSGSLPAPMRYKLWISYDSQNSFGVMIRGKSRCDYIAEDGTLDFANEFNVRIDGFDKTEWLAEMIKQSKG